MRRFVLLGVMLLLILVTASSSFAVSRAGVLFLMIAPGARASGMGESFVAVADDATASYWNPAGLGFLKGKELVLMHSKWFPQFADDMYYEFLSYSHYVEGWGGVGGHIIYLTYGKIPYTTEFGPQIQYLFESYELAASLSYGTDVADDICVGVNMKGIYSNLGPGQNVEKGDGKAMSYAVDIGVLYRELLPKLSLGAMVHNLGPNIMYIDAEQSSPLPRNLKVGVAYKLLNTQYNSILLTSELNTSLVEEEFRGNAGFEYWYSTILALRAGYIYDDYGEIKTPTFGAGLQYSKYRFDFGYIPEKEGHPLADTMRFSLTAKF
jgi:hypothetical protein